MPSSSRAASQATATPLWRQAWQHEARDLCSALAGGAIIGMPLLFTMEMWWHGAVLAPGHMLLLLAIGVILNWGFGLISGFRDKYSPLDALSEAFTSIAIGVVFSIAVLALIGEIDGQDSLRLKATTILITALAVSVGASFGNSQVRKQSRTGEEGDEDSDKNPNKMSPDEREAAQWKADWQDVGATVAGSVVFAINVAPTEEILLVAARLSPWQQVAILACEVALGYAIVFASGLAEEGDFTHTPAQKPIAETLLATSVSLGVAAMLVLLIGQRAALDSPTLFLASTITLGMTAVVGGAAGRIIA